MLLHRHVVGQGSRRYGYVVGTEVMNRKWQALTAIGEAARAATLVV